jgi:CubicO group peptidase (beta-lactamase class C family)
MYRLFNIILLILGILLAGCLKSGDLKIAKNATPQQLDDGWIVSTPQSAGLNSAILDQVVDMFFDEDLYPTSKSLLIIKDNKLVLESYARDLSDRDRLHNVRSVTKGITAILFGIAIDEGLFDADLNRTVYSYIPLYFDSVELKKDISIYHMLTMRSGLNWDNKENTQELFNNSRFPSSMRLVVQQPMNYTPGTWFNFNDGTPHIFSGMIADTTKKSLEEFADEHLFSKIGISDYFWEKHEDGLNYGSAGLYLKPRDMARIGQVMAENGTWNSEQIVSSGWINACTTQQLSEAYTLFEPIGFYWWVRPDYNAFCAIGNGGQFIYVVPSRNLVIVHTALPFTGNDYKGVELIDFEKLVDLILQADG